ncbi:unnamed protein product [Lampetra planeri]
MSREERHISRGRPLRREGARGKPAQAATSIGHDGQKSWCLQMSSARRRSSRERDGANGGACRHAEGAGSDAWTCEPCGRGIARRRRHGFPTSRGGSSSSSSSAHVPLTSG